MPYPAVLVCGRRTAITVEPRERLTPPALLTHGGASTMKQPRNDISVAEIRRVLSYDPETGVLTWKPRPAVDRFAKTWNTRFAGKPAGTVGQNGYIFIWLGGRNLLAHRVAYVLMKGRWPEHEIDHENRHRADNRWDNLRDATISQNNANKESPANTVSGYRGVRWHKASRKWHARITVNRKEHSLGYYDVKEDAARAYNEGALRLRGQFAQLNVIPAREGGS